MTNKLSTELATHKIHYKEGEIFKTVIVTEKEAAKASNQWQAWRPVPIPNTKDPQRSDILYTPTAIVKIERFTR